MSRIGDAMQVKGRTGAFVAALDCVELEYGEKFHTFEESS